MEKAADAPERVGFSEQWIAEAGREGDLYQTEADNLLTAFLEVKKSMERL